jgi:dipeptidyl aminopeptidase/acylaminoacyl peptidase
MSWTSSRSLKRILLVAALALVAALGLVTIPFTAQAVFNGTPGRIAFDNLYDGNIYTMYIDGTGLQQLTFDGRSNHPAWSPDGTKIAFSRRGNIFVMSAGGTNIRQVTTLGRSYQPAWSPDGKRLLFVHVPLGKPGDIWVVPSKGGTQRRLTYDASSTCGDSHPVWSPLGGKIAYDQTPGTFDAGSCVNVQYPRVIVLTLATGAKGAIPYADNPDFTADGTGLFFGSSYDTQNGYVSPYNMAWSNLRGGSRTLLTNFYCAEGESCFQEGAGAPDSTFPTNPSDVFITTNSDDLGGYYCLGENTATTTSSTSLCSRWPGAPDVWPRHLDWQRLPTGS